jgi:hypothetical protein
MKTKSIALRRERHGALAWERKGESHELYSPRAGHRAASVNYARKIC